MRRTLSQLTYHIFNILNGGILAEYYQQVKKANENHEPFENSSISEYLKHWGFNPRIEENSLMNKEDVNRWTEKVHPENVHDWAYTGGSYGEPLRIPYSKQRAFKRTATFRYFNECGGYKLGDSYLLIRAKEKPGWMKFVRNEHIFIPDDISEKKLDELTKLIKKKGILVLMGYPTVIYELALFLKRFPEKKNGLSVNSIISISEPLEQIKREVIRDVFTCSFIDRYSNEEVGMIAQQEKFGSEYFVNKYGVYTEIVDPDNYQPVNEGESGKVVVTDIFNDLIPVIRYDTGDYAIANRYEKGQLLSIKHIAGRETEQIHAFDGSRVSPLMLGPYIYKPLAETGTVYQFQFAQTGDGTYDLRLKANPGEVPESVARRITGGLENVLGKKSNISVVYVNEIKPQPSGKRPIYKNEIKNRIS